MKFMAQLNKILSSVLCDMVSAQHEANMYAIRLSASYGKGGINSFVKPPVVCLGEMELTLHCSFTGSVMTGNVPHTVPALVSEAIHGIASHISDVIVSSVISTLLSFNDNKGDSPVRKMSDDEELRKNFTEFLSRKLYSHLYDSRMYFISSDGKIDSDILFDNIYHVVKNEFITHNEMKNIFSGSNGSKKLEAVQKNMETNVKLSLKHSVENIKIAVPQECSSLEVNVGADELSKLPAGCIQTIRLRISPGDFPVDSVTEL